MTVNFFVKLCVLPDVFDREVCLTEGCVSVAPSASHHRPPSSLLCPRVQQQGARHPAGERAGCPADSLLHQGHVC